MGIAVETFVDDPVNANFICAICHSVLDNAVSCRQVCAHHPAHALPLCLLTPRYHSGAPVLRCMYQDVAFDSGRAKDMPMRPFTSPGTCCHSILDIYLLPRLMPSANRLSNWCRAWSSGTSSARSPCAVLTARSYCHHQHSLWWQHSHNHLVQAYRQSETVNDTTSPHRRSSSEMVTPFPDS
jgi:hypothetical protein